MEIVGSVEDYLYDASGSPAIGEDGQRIVNEYPITLALTQDVRSFFDIEFGFDIPAPHTLSWWYANQAFLSLIELDEDENLYNIYDALNITKATYTPSVDPAPAPSAAGHAVKKLL